MTEDHEVRILLGIVEWERPSTQNAAVPPYLEKAYARISVAESLGAREEISIIAIAALTRASIADEDERVREAAIRALVAHHSQSSAISIVGSAAFDPDDNVRWTALTLLRQMSQKAALEFASRLVKDDDETVAEYAESLLDEARTFPGSDATSRKSQE